MKLHINTADRFNKEIVLDEERLPFEGDLLEAIVGVLEARGKTLHDLTEITTNLGPGSFTSLRVGISVANTLNYALGLRSLDQLDVPAYGKEPNISTPKKS